ncbi:MAG: class I mannose-6-phosphate isomerase, partial [Candidatus Marinimicrobia bacterium]|nr:class I mannose-6-phosphate isomerase [Candidatus Neomarinimicrobiota bacterium]
MNQDWMPLAFQPVYKDYIWGGARLATQLGRAEAPARAAESWEVADHADGQSVVADGPLAGQTLRDLCRAHGAALLGTVATEAVFPLLIKLIDARECLSVQVHPDDAAAARF